MARHDNRKLQKKITVAKLEKSKAIRKPKKVTAPGIVMPAIFSDIDGVLLKGTLNAKGIGSSDEMIIKILTTTRSDKQIPFFCMTNGGTETEQSKADKLNKLLKFEEPKLAAENLILCNSIYGGEKIQSEFQNKLVLVDGMAHDDVQLAQSYGFKKVISLLELCSLFPDISPLTMLDFLGNVDKLIKTKVALLARFSMSEADFKAQL